jgi:hypothetical protein
VSATAQFSVHPGHGQALNRLADGGGLLNCRKLVRPGARVMLLLAPGMFRLDVRNDEDSHHLTLRGFGSHVVEGGPAHARSRTVMGIDGMLTKLTEFDFALVGSGHDRIRVAVTTPARPRQFDELPCGAAAQLPPTWPSLQ